MSPDKPENLESWFVLRTKIIEDDRHEIKLKDSIHLMNSAFFMIVCFMLWMLYLYFVKE